MQISKLFSFIAVALLVSAALVGLVSISAVAQAEATPTGAATPAVATATPKIVGATETNTTISTSIEHPKIGGNATIYVYVRAGTAGLPSKPVHVNHTYPGSMIPAEDGWFTTGTSGAFSFSSGTYGSAGPRVYTAVFAGDSQYAASSGTVTVNVQPAATPTTTTTIIAADSKNPHVGSATNLTVYVRAGSTVLTNKNFTVTHTWPGSTTPGKDGVFNTGSTGIKTFSSGTYGSAGQRVYTAVFAGDSQYAASSGTVTVNVGMTPSTITMTASNANPPVDQTVTFTVNLKSGSTGLSKSVKIWHIVFIGDMVLRYEDGTHTTDSNGTYKFNQAFGTAGQRIYHAEFAGDSQYGSSSGTVTVNVGTTPTKATTTMITASNPNPTVGSGITLSVTVKAGTTILTNKQVTVTHTYPGSTTPGKDGVFDTGATGTKTFSATYGSAGQRVYTAAFAGDSQYAASSGTVMVNVGTTTATTTMITALNTNPTVGQSVTFSVYLKAGTAGLNSKPVTIWHSWPGGTHAMDGTFNTVNGVYKFTQAFGSTGQRIYHAEFAGDSQYAASSGTVTVNVQLR